MSEFFRKNYKRWIITLVLVVVLIALAIGAYQKGISRKDLVYAESLDKVAVTVDGRDLTLKDLAFYIAYEEAEVEKEAQVYDEDDTNKYWNLHIDGVFVKVSAKNAIIQMAVHDESFYQAAVKEGIELNEEEYKLLDSSVEDFWNDLQDYDKTERLNVTREDISVQMEKVTLAQKYQIIQAGMSGESYESFAFSGEGYEKLLEEHQYKIRESVWNRIPIGNVTLHH